MGQAQAAFEKVSKLFEDSKVETMATEVKEKVEADPRRRNSLAFNITQFVAWEEEEYDELVADAVEETEKRLHKYKNAKPTKLSKIATNILLGSFPELRRQCCVHYKSINRQFQDQFELSQILHFCATEGFYEMIEFVMDPSNHTDIDDSVVLELNTHNGRKRSPLMLCFTPPHCTFLGQRFGVASDGNAISERPEGVTLATDWVKPGGPKNREKCIQSLLKGGADVKEKDFHDFTLLHYACMWGWVSTAKVLLNYGADINAQTIVGKTSLMYAVDLMNDKLVQMLCENDDLVINSCDGDGNTPLILAVEKGNEVDSDGDKNDTLKICEFLVKAGADVNFITKKKKTPLLIACKRQNADQVNFLLSNKVQRKPEVIGLLEEEAFEIIDKRLKADEKALEDEAQRKLKEKQRLEDEGKIDINKCGYRNKSPWGAWVDYSDKRGRGIFYYNPVTRVSTFDKPKDFIPVKGRIQEEHTFGMSFYHTKVI
jgi:serine/threonine-protein phosphatase 6 regulatory ankyrin repeat subunit A